MQYHVKLPNLPETIYFCRHGQSTGNEKGLNDASVKELANHRFPLTALGRSQAEQLGRYVRSEGILNACGEITVSTFLRAEQTLDGVIALNSTSLTIYQDLRLDEWWKGIFHSMSAEERATHYPAEEAIRQREGWYHYRAPQGESGKDVEMRLLNFLQDIQTVPFIVSHGRVGAFLDRLLCARDLDRTCGYPDMKNCELLRFTKKGSAYHRDSLFSPV